MVFRLWDAFLYINTHICVWGTADLLHWLFKTPDLFPLESLKPLLLVLLMKSYRHICYSDMFKICDSSLSDHKISVYERCELACVGASNGSFKLQEADCAWPHLTLRPTHTGAHRWVQVLLITFSAYWAFRLRRNTFLRLLIMYLFPNTALVWLKTRKEHLFIIRRLLLHNAFSMMWKLMMRLKIL